MVPPVYVLAPVTSISPAPALVSPTEPVEEMALATNRSMAAAPLATVNVPPLLGVPRPLPLRSRMPVALITAGMSEAFTVMGESIM